MRDNRYRGSGGGLFWTASSWGAALIAGGIFGYILSNFYGQGPTSGLMFGAVVFLVSGAIWSRYATGAPLPAPNTIEPPVAPPGGAFTVKGGATTTERRRDQPDMGAAVTEVLGTAQEKVSQVVAGAAALVSSRKSGAAERTPQDPDRAQAADAPQRPAFEPSPSAEPVESHPAPEPREIETEAAFAEPETTFVEPDATFAEPQPASVQPLETGSAETAAVGTQPAGLFEPREGGADDLKRITGIDAATEGWLHGLGIYYFDQVAAWTSDQVAWIDAHLEGGDGRASRNDWVGQASRLAVEETEAMPRDGNDSD